MMTYFGNDSGDASDEDGDYIDDTERVDEKTYDDHKNMMRMVNW